MPERDHFQPRPIVLAPRTGTAGGTVDHNYTDPFLNLYGPMGAVQQAGSDHLNVLDRAIAEQLQVNQSPLPTSSELPGGLPPPQSSQSFLPSASGFDSSKLGNALYGIGLALGSASGGSRGDFSLPINHMNMQQNRQQMQQAAELRKQAFMQQQQQLEEQKRHHEQSMLWDLMKGGSIESVKAFAEQYNGTETGRLAKNIAIAMNDGMLAHLPGFVEKGWITQEEVADAKNWSPSRLKAKVQTLMKREEINNKAMEDQAILREALNKKQAGKELDAFEMQVIKDHETEMELKASDKRLKDAQAEKALRPPEDKSEIGKIAEAVGGKPWNQMTQEEKRAVIEWDKQKDIDVAAGRARASQEAALNIPDKPTAGERKELAEDLASIGRIDALAGMFNPEFVGRVRGMVGGVKEWAGLIGSDEATLRAEVATLKNQIIKQITGAAMSEPEARRIMAQLPDMTNSPDVFMARLKMTRDNMLMLAQKRRDIMQQTGIDLSRVAPLPSGGMPQPQSTGAFVIHPNEVEFAKGLKAQGKTKEEVMQAILQRRGQ